MLTWSWLPCSCSYLSVYKVITAEYSRTVQKVFNLQFDFLLPTVQFVFNSVSKITFHTSPLESTRSIFPLFHLHRHATEWQLWRNFLFFLQCPGSTSSNNANTLSDYLDPVEGSLPELPFYLKKALTLASAPTFAHGTSHPETTAPSITCCSFYLCIITLHQCLAVKFAFWLSSLSYIVL